MIFDTEPGKSPPLFRTIDLNDDGTEKTAKDYKQDQINFWVGKLILFLIFLVCFPLCIVHVHDRSWAMFEAFFLPLSLLIMFSFVS